MIEFIFKIIETIFKIDKDELLKIIKESMYILFAAAIIGFIVNIFHPRGFTFVSSSIYNEKNIVLISSDEAKIKIDSGAAVIIDSRTVEEYRDASIPGAVNIPAVPDSLSAKRIKENYGLINGPAELVIYCDGTSCGSSQILAARLLEMGYSKHIYIIEHGLPEWKEKGFPVEKTEARNK